MLLRCRAAGDTEFGSCPAGILRMEGGQASTAILNQLGPEPLDAYRRFLEDEQRAGAFTIHNEAFADTFWRYFTDESKHDFMAPDGDDAARTFLVLPWQRGQ